MVWGEQVLDLWGAPSVPYSTARVPLLGLGQETTAWQRVVTTTGFAVGAATGLAVGALTMHLMHRYHVMGMR
jgi:hypothetical protein